MQHIIQQSKSFFQYPWLETIVWAAGLLVAAFMINYLIRHLLLRGSYRLLALIDHGEDADIRRTIRHLANIAPALVFLFGIRLIPAIPAQVATVIQNVSKAFIIFTIALALIALLNFIHMLYRLRPEAKSMSIKGMIQIAEIVIFAVATILVLSTLIDQSPFILLSGLGAMAAVLILVFQDTLLSFVTGIQISSTDMIRVGDWIEVSNLGADGDVIDIALHTVKVQNFDNTITTVPIRKFVTDPFKNWRGMQESGGRRIKRALYIDQSSIGFLNEKDIKRLSHHRQLKTYMQDKQKEIAEWNSRLDTHETITADIRKLTNIGTFRAYVFAYIKNHPGIHQKMTILVRQTAPGPEGLPLEIYCFTNTVNWHEYEAIQSDIFDHLYSILPSFGLRVFQSPGGHDMQLMLSAMKTGKIILKTENQPGD